MAWIKRNLFFVVGGILAIGLLGAAGFYNYKGWSHNTAASNELQNIYRELNELATKKPSPGNDKVNNKQAAKDQERLYREWIQQSADHFQPIAPIPNPGNNAVSSEAFASALRKTIVLLQQEAEAASVILPPKYSFSFEAQRSLLKIAPASLGPLSEQLGEVKAVAEVFYAAHVDSLDGIQRVRVSDDDASGSQADYFEGHSVTNNLAVLTPYQITFRSFSPEVGEVLAGFASSPRGFIVKSVNVQMAGANVATAMGSSGEGGPPPPPLPLPTAPPPLMMSKGGLQTVLDEQLLRVTLVVEIVKLLPKR